MKKIIIRTSDGESESESTIESVGLQKGQKQWLESFQSKRTKLFSNIILNTHSHKLINI